MTLSFVNDHFDITADMIGWKVCDESHVRIGDQFTLNRARAGTVAQGMKPVTDYGKSIRNMMIRLGSRVAQSKPSFPSSDRY